MKTNNIIIEKSTIYYKIRQLDDESNGENNYILLLEQELIDLPEIIKSFLEKENATN